MKYCNTCGATSARAKFYKGTFGVCARCHNLNAKRRYWQGRKPRTVFSPEERRRRARECLRRWRAKNKEKDQKTRRIYYRRFPTKHRQWSKRWHRKHPKANSAYHKVHDAVSSGIIRKPQFCSICGKRGLLHAHHYDYDKPLLVVWLCPSCHRHIGLSRSLFLAFR